MTTSFKSAAVFIAVGAAGLAPTAINAASFQILEQSPARLGTAFAGTASVADDASTVFFNPAGMARLDGRQISAAGHLILVESKFTNIGSTSATGGPLLGEDGKTDKPGFVPNLYYVQPLAERWWFGIGINAPYGLASDYDSDWIGRYHATESELSVISVNPTLAYSVNDQFSVGFGLSYQRAETTLRNQVDSFNTCIAAGGSGANCTGLHGSSGNRASDSSAKVEGNDRDVIVDLSIHWQPLAQTRIGLIWRQGAEFTLEGDANFTPSSSCAADPFCSGTLQTLGGNVEADVELPDTITLSASHQLSERWQLHGDVAWTEWSTIQEVNVVNTGNGLSVTTLDLNYDDTMRYAAGASFTPDKTWTWRFGVAVDEAPQTDRQYVSPRIPDADRVWISTGFNYAFSRDASVDVGYAHLFIDDTRIDSVQQGNQLAGQFKASVDIFGVQGNWRF